MITSLQNEILGKTTEMPKLEMENDIKSNATWNYYFKIFIDVFFSLFDEFKEDTYTWKF